MESEVLKTVGQVGGIGGIAIGVMLLVFRSMIAKNIFPKLSAEKSYRLLRLITASVWSLAILGVVAWVYLGGAPAATQSTEIKGDGNTTTQKIVKEAAPAGDSKPIEQTSTIQGKGNTVVQEKID